MSSTAGAERWKGKVAIVTGASSGIGAAISRSLVALGMKVVGVARSLDKMQVLAEELAGQPGSLIPTKCDISKDEDVNRMFGEVLRLHGAVHCCINNAGVMMNYSLLDGDPSVWRSMLDVHVVGLCLLTKLAVNSMMEKGIDDGHIIHINSTHGHRIHSRPVSHFYAATKHAVTALTEGLRQELRAAKSHIRVTSISPGLTQTELFYNMSGDAAAAEKFYAQIETLQPEDVAASVVHALTAPPRVEINNILMRPTEQAH